MDGTVNFARGLPIFSISIAARKKNTTVAGVIYQPLTQELFTCEKGQGAYLNSQKITVSKTAKIQKALAATGFPYDLDKNPFNCIENLLQILKRGLPIRRLGSAAIDLAYLAAGRFDFYFEAYLQPWDCAAGQLLLEEAGGKLSHWDGRPFDIFAKQPLLATNTLLHQVILEIFGAKK